MYAVYQEIVDQKTYYFGFGYDILDLLVKL